MKYMVMDAGRSVKVEVTAASPIQAREQAKRQLSSRGWIGDLEVYEKEDPLKGKQREATQEFFGARPPIIL